MNGMSEWAQASDECFNTWVTDPSNDNLHKLWFSVERLVMRWARRYMRKAVGTGYAALTCNYEFDDLVQAGYLALCDLASRWPCQFNNSFRWNLFYAVWHRFSECAGTGGRGKLRLESYKAGHSLDEYAHENKKATRSDMLADPSAEFEEDLIEKISINQDYEAILTEIEKLPENKRQALLLTARDGLSGEEAGKLLGRNAAQVAQLRSDAVDKVRSSRTGRIIGRSYQVRHVGLDEFLRTRTSEVEKAVLWITEGV